MKAEIESRMHIVCTDNYGLTEVMGPGVSGECLAEMCIRDRDSDVQAFVAQMNATAQKLGCTNTVYENPHGLDSVSYTHLIALKGCDLADVNNIILTIDPCISCTER